MLTRAPFLCRSKVDTYGAMLALLEHFEFCFRLRRYGPDGGEIQFSDGESLVPVTNVVLLSSFSFFFVCNPLP